MSPRKIALIDFPPRENFFLKQMSLSICELYSFILSYLMYSLQKIKEL